MGFLRGIVVFHQLLAGAFAVGHRLALGLVPYLGGVGIEDTIRGAESRTDLSPGEIHTLEASGDLSAREAGMVKLALGEPAADQPRPRLAEAYSNDENGETWTKNDIRSEFFQEIQKIRNDIAHHQGQCIDSSDNKLFDWLEPGEFIAPTPRQMLHLNQFPKNELCQRPDHEEIKREKSSSFLLLWRPGGSRNC